MARLLAEISLYEMFFYLMCAWIVVDCWQRFVESFMRDTLHMNSQSSYHNFIIAFVLLGIFIILITAGDIILRDFSDAFDSQQTSSSSSQTMREETQPWQSNIEWDYKYDGQWKGNNQSDFCSNCARRCRWIWDDDRVAPVQQLHGGDAGQVPNDYAEKGVRRIPHSRRKSRHAQDHLSKVDGTQSTRRNTTDLPQDFLVVRRR